MNDQVNANVLICHLRQIGTALLVSLPAEADQVQSSGFRLRRRRSKNGENLNFFVIRTTLFVISTTQRWGVTKKL